jgi:predicted tellurium resistance membrane protein TerC
MKEPFWTFHTDFAHAAFSGQSIILIIGGLFLLYKSTSEIRDKVEGDGHHDLDSTSKAGLSNAIVQITLINIVFSFDSILTAVGMTNGMEGALILMVIAVILSVIIMLLFANPVGNFVQKHPTIQMLGLSFLILIGFMLIAEGMHLAHADIFGKEVGVIPKGYLYFAISFSLLVEFLNMRIRKPGKKQAMKS